MKMISRRDFIKASAVVGAAGGWSGLADVSVCSAADVVDWRRDIRRVVAGTYAVLRRDRAAGLYPRVGGGKPVRGRQFHPLAAVAIGRLGGTRLVPGAAADHEGDLAHQPRRFCRTAAGGDGRVWGGGAGDGR